MQYNWKKANTSKDSFLRRKKYLFQEQIRRHEKDRILTMLRQQALMPEQIWVLLHDLPSSLQQILKVISRKEGIPQAWSKVISGKLFDACLTQPQPFFGAQVPVNIQISLAMFITSNKQLSSAEFDLMWSRLQANSKVWDTQQQKILLKLLADAIYKIDFKYLKPAKQILNKYQERYDQRILSFYNFVVKHCPQQALLQNILHSQLFNNIIDHLKIFFYSPTQKIKMCELLIQVLYQSNAEVVAQSWNLTRLFDILQFFIGSDTKLLIQRSLILIYNVNIDCGSKIFLTHPCVEAVVQQMRNDELPLEIRELMADTYLSALVNLPRQNIPKYIQNHSKILQKTLTYIIEQLSQNKDIQKGIQDTLKMILELDQQSQPVFRNWLQAKPQLIDAVKHSPFGKQLLQQHDLI